MDLTLYEQLFQLEGRHWWFTARREILLALLRRYLPRRQGNNILDIGCGAGLMLQSLAEFGTVCGVDTSPLAVAYSASRGAGQVQLGSLPDQLPFPPATFDLITLLDVLEHIPDDVGALSAVRAQLKPGGLLLCTVPAFRLLWSNHDTIHQHQRRYARREVRDKLHAAGFTVRRHSYYNSLLFPPIAAVRLLRRLLPEHAPHSDASMPPRPLNALLYHLFAAERLWLTHADFPVGVSELAVAVKEE